MRDSVSLDLKLSYSENGRSMGTVEAATDLWHFAQRHSTEKRVSRNPYIALSCGIFPSKRFCDLQARRAPIIIRLKVSAGDSVDFRAEIVDEAMSTYESPPVLTAAGV